MRAAIVGIAGPQLTDAEAALFRACPPAGIILFARNIEDRAQLRLLVTGLREVLRREPVLLVDQEGGRVARLRPPHWRAHPPAGTIGRMFEENSSVGLRAAWITGALIGTDCAEAGFDVACAPVLDLRRPDAHGVIGDRAFGEAPLAVARLGRAFAAGLLAAGIQPVGKHAPGHGRARLDSHVSLPIVEANDLDSDLLPFALNADLPWAMSAHILYKAWDAVRPATLSPVVIGEVIRRRIGFEGVLVTDDLAMGALSGAPDELARSALAAGCDVALYCAGEFEPTAALLRTCPELTGPALSRLSAARASADASRIPLDVAALQGERDRLLGGTASA